LVRIQKTVSSLIKHTIGTRIYDLEIKYQDLENIVVLQENIGLKRELSLSSSLALKKEERLWLCYIGIGPKSRDGRRWAEETSSIPV
jgi:hypothetical protein